MKSLEKRRSATVVSAPVIRKRPAPRGSIFVAVGALAIALALVAFMGRHYLWQWAANPLFEGNAPEKADILYVLGGDYGMRGSLAARLLHQGYAPIIVFARESNDAQFRKNQTDLLINTLRKEGIQPQQIVQLVTSGGVSSTAAEVLALKRYVASGHPMSKVIIVTSTFHGRRARMAAERALGGLGIQVRVVTGDSRFAGKDNWQDNPIGREQVRSEMAKMIYYFFTFFG